MDKFGIFKLLNGFLDAYKNFQPKTTSSSQENEQSINDKNPLSSLFSQTAEEKPKPLKTTPKTTPLQNDMLSTINNHDLLVKRVKEKNR